MQQMQIKNTKKCSSPSLSSSTKQKVLWRIKILKVTSGKNVLENLLQVGKNTLLCSRVKN
jgi:hypothetical protein